MSVRCHLNRPALVLLFGAVLAACAGSGVRVDQETNADLSRCNRFAWMGQSNDPASLTDQRIRDAALESMRAKGYTVVEREADCELSYVIDISNRSRSRSSFSFGMGGGSGNVGAGAGVTVPLGNNKLRAAIVRLNVYDSTRRTQIWTASYDTEVADPVTPEQANKVVSEILKKYPDSTLLKQ